MNRINPIYIAVLLLILLVFLVYKLDATKIELKENEEAYKITKNIALQLTSLKDVYADKQNIKKSLQKILKHPSLKSASLDIKFKKSSFVLGSQSMDISKLNLLVGKLLNATFIIESMNVKRVSDTKVELKMEIKW